MDGLIFVGYVISMLLLVRLWQRTRDEVLAAFAVSFALMAAGQVLVMKATGGLETCGYLLRMTAFCLVIAEVLRKKLAD